MRGTYEAFILVKVKDGRKFVCALNKQKVTRQNSGRLAPEELEYYLKKRVIWN